jgi:hypothetical protein
MDTTLLALKIIQATKTINTTFVKETYLLYNKNTDGNVKKRKKTKMFIY